LVLTASSARFRSLARLFSYDAVKKAIGSSLARFTLRPVAMRSVVLRKSFSKSFNICTLLRALLDRSTLSITPSRIARPAGLQRRWKILTLDPNWLEYYQGKLVARWNPPLGCNSNLLQILTIRDTARSFFPRLLALSCPGVSRPGRAGGEADRAKRHAK